MKRAQTVGLALTGVLVLVLVGSLVAGLRGPSGEAGTELPEEARGERVRVEVLNAAGIPGLARRATEQLRESGFDVVYFGNGRTFHADTSLVLDRVRREAMAAAVAEAMEIERVRSVPDSTLYVDVTVVVGRDWVGVPRPQDPAAGPDGGP